MVDLDTWHALGPALERLVAAAEHAVIAAYHEHLRSVLTAGGVEEGDPLLTRASALTPRLDGWGLGMQASTGALGPEMRMRHDEWREASELHRQWSALDEELEDLDDPWEGLLEDLDDRGPPTPEAAIQALGALAGELAAMGHVPFGSWPLVATGERRSDLLGQALTQLSARAGVPREQLPPIPFDIDDEPVLVLAPAAQAIEQVYEWMLHRQGRARLLGRLRELLPGS